MMKGEGLGDADLLFRNENALHGETQAKLVAALEEIENLKEGMRDWVSAYHDLRVRKRRAIRRLRKSQKRALRTRPDYDFRCQDCGAPHNVDTSIPSEIWNAIAENRPGVLPGAAGIGMPEVGALCTLCIDERLVKAGLRCDEAEFYYVGTALSSKRYK